MSERESVLLVIGVHREELAFGEQVAARLADRSDLPALEVLRIPDGLSGRNPRDDERFRHAVAHGELYRQIRQIAGQRALVIDLHQGFDDAGPGADLYCGAAGLLIDLGARFAGWRGRCIRLVNLTDRDPVPGAVPGRTVIPEDVWNSPNFGFVGVEIYLPAPRPGSRRTGPSPPT